MKKIKGHFWSQSTRPSRPVPSNSAFGLAVVCEHWTPWGDCKVTGNKERNKKMIGPKKVHQKWISSSILQKKSFEISSFFRKGVNFTKEIL